MRIVDFFLEVVTYFVTVVCLINLAGCTHSQSSSSNNSNSLTEQQLVGYWQVGLSDVNKELPPLEALATGQKGLVLKFKRDNSVEGYVPCALREAVKNNRQVKNKLLTGSWELGANNNMKLSLSVKEANAVQDSFVTQGQASLRSSALPNGVTTLTIKHGEQFSVYGKFSMDGESCDTERQ